MPKPKFKIYVEKMLAEEPALFAKFRQVHDKFEKDQEKYQKEFNQVGEKVIKLMREYEARLCKSSEGTYNQFTPKLAEKFQQEVKKTFPMIDWVGVVSKKPIRAKEKLNFVLKKISLN